MTDIADHDRRAARAWAKNWQGDQDDDTSAAARVILATVDAPEPTLTERLRKQFYDPEPTDEQHGIILDAAQMEHDLTEARAELNQWKQVSRIETTTLREQRDEAHADLADVTEVNHEIRRERDEARAEAERLTDVNETLRRTDNHKEFREQFLTVQKRAESNAESPDPADVKPGEAWIVECRGERRNAVKDRDDNYPWTTVTGGGWMSSMSNKEVTLITRLVPAPRVITNADELDRLAEGTIIRARDGDACRKADGGDWSVDGLDGAVGYGPRQVLPVTVLWEPEVEATESH